MQNDLVIINCLKSCGELFTIGERNDLFDGKVIHDIGIGTGAMDGDELAFWVRFSDNSQGIYLAQLSSVTSVPEPSSLALLSLATAGLAIARRGRKNRRARHKPAAKPGA